MVYNLNREHLMLKMLKDSMSQDQLKLLENYLKLAEGNLPLNQLYVDLNNEEQVNIRKEKDAESEAVEMVLSMLSNIKNEPDKDSYIHLMMETDPFCQFRRVLDILKEELSNG